MNRTEPQHAPNSADAMPIRVAPHNIEAEQALLGAILINNEAHDRVSGFLEPEHFYDPLHKEIYETAAKVITSGKMATPVTLRTFFEKAEPIDAGLTVPQYLGRLAANASTIINTRDYGQTIRDLATRRQLILIGEDLVNVAFDSPVDFPPKKQIETAEAQLYALAEHGTNEREAVRLESDVASAVAEINAAYQRGGGIAGLSTSLAALDAETGGWLEGNLIVLAARPSMGKSALLFGTCLHAARNGTPSVIFSLEMTSRDITYRYLAAETGVPVLDLRAGNLGDSDSAGAVNRKLIDAQRRLKDVGLYTDESGGLTMPQLAAKARRLCRKHRVGLIGVDYTQLMNGTTYRGQNRVQEITEITNGLKALAKELKVPVIALSQLNRKVEEREDKRPQLHDLRESGSLEQDADVIVFLFRDEYYLKRSEPPPDKAAELAEWRPKMQAARGRAELIIGKQRQGAITTVNVAFCERTMRFSDLPANGGR